MHNGVMEAVQGKVISIDEEGSLPLSGFLPVLEKNRIHIWSARYSDQFFLS